MGTARVVLRKCRKLKDGRYPIAIRITHNKKAKYIFTGYSALEREWNGKYQTYLNNKHPNQKELNHYADHTRNQVFTHQEELERNAKVICTKTLINKYLNIDDAKKSILQTYGEYNDKKFRLIGKGVAFNISKRH